MSRTKKQRIMTTNSCSQNNSRPYRVRSVQTEPVTSTDVSIQCNRDEDDDCFEALPSTESNGHFNEEREFQTYVDQHTTIFSNGMLGCAVCGEVAKDLQVHRYHMSFHYGPQTLCSECGKFVEHVQLLAQHKHSCRARAHPKSRLDMSMQCPHVQCSFMITSKRHFRLHLCRHLINKPYQCLQCRQRFNSDTHFLVHRMLNSSCRRAKHRYLSKNSSKLRQQTKINRCSVCLSRFSTAKRCLQHKRRCIQQHHRRLSRLLRNSIKLKLI